MRADRFPFTLRFSQPTREYRIGQKPYGIRTGMWVFLHNKTTGYEKFRFHLIYLEHSIL